MVRLQVALIGSQSTGKTTLANAYIDHMVSLERDGYATDDGCSRAVAERDIAINEKGSYITQIEITKELVSRFKPGINRDKDNVCYYPRIIRVSTLVRIWAYMKYHIESGKKFVDADIAAVDLFHEWALYELYTVFNEVIYLPVEFELVEDGVRSTSKEYQLTIDGYIREILKESGVSYHTITGDVKQRFEKLRAILFHY